MAHHANMVASVTESGDMGVLDDLPWSENPINFDQQTAYLYGLDVENGFLQQFSGQGQGMLDNNDISCFDPDNLRTAAVPEVLFTPLN